MACSFGPAPDAKLSTAAFVNANSSLVLSCATDSTYLQMKVVCFFFGKEYIYGERQRAAASNRATGGIQTNGAAYSRISDGGPK